MRVSLKPIGRWGLLLVSAAALWSMGPGAYGGRNRYLRRNVPPW
jgi:hypothetical protein